MWCGAPSPIPNGSRCGSFPTTSSRWKGGHEELKGFGHYIDTLVTWTLTPTPSGGTHFRFFHDGFGTDGANDGVFEIMSKGSQSVLRTLTRRLPDLIAHGA